MDTEINWGRIHRAVEFYKEAGYKYIEAPWNVSKRSILDTIPDPNMLLETAQGYPVGSGEQSFIELLRQGTKVGKAVCCTPCFRQEKEYDSIHFPYFMKVELINTDSVTYDELKNTIKHAMKFFNSEGIRTELACNKAPEIDLNDKSGMELGSYGIRDLGNLKFVYGTGLAEPRASLSLEKANKCI